MTIGEFLSDRLDRLLIQVICIASAVLFLKATGTQSGERCSCSIFSASGSGFGN